MQKIILRLKPARKAKMPKPSVLGFPVQKVSKGHSHTNQDLLAVEEPLEIRLNYGKNNSRKQKSISVTMRTPGNDFELALGFLFGEGIIQQEQEIKDIRYCTEIKDPSEENNILIIYLDQDVTPDLTSAERNFYTHSSCGVCGKTSIEHLNQLGCQSLPNDGLVVSADTLKELPGKIRAKQVVFAHTGGLHAAGLFNEQGELGPLREDIGRHNALDKLIGTKFLESKLPLNKSICLVSGRAGFELVQKSIAAGIPIMAAVGAPSSLACQLAQEYNLTLVGFLRETSFNIYSGAHRISA